MRAHIDFLSEVDDLSKRPRCTGKIKSNLHTFSSLQVHTIRHPVLPQGYPVYPDLTHTSFRSDLVGGGGGGQL